MELNLRAKRMAKGKTVPEIAKKIKRTRASVYDWEAGKSVPDPKMIPILAEIYDVDAEDLANHFVALGKRNKEQRREAVSAK